MVIPKEGGPYSLFCTDCHKWIPNTANYEMKKEGFFAHSHICKLKQDDEIDDSEWQEAGCDWKVWHELHLRKKMVNNYGS